MRIWQHCAKSEETVINMCPALGEAQGWKTATQRRINHRVRCTHCACLQCLDKCWCTTRLGSWEIEYLAVVRQSCGDVWSKEGAKLWRGQAVARLQRLRGSQASAHKHLKSRSCLIPNVSTSIGYMSPRVTMLNHPLLLQAKWPWNDHLRCHVPHALTKDKGHSTKHILLKRQMGMLSSRMCTRCPCKSRMQSCVRHSCGQLFASHFKTDVKPACLSALVTTWPTIPSRPGVNVVKGRCCPTAPLRKNWIAKRRHEGVTCELDIGSHERMSTHTHS